MAWLLPSGGEASAVEDGELLLEVITMMTMMMIYIMMKCECVTENRHFLSAQSERQRRKVRHPLDLAGRRLALAYW